MTTIYKTINKGLSNGLFSFGILFSVTSESDYDIITDLVAINTRIRSWVYADIGQPYPIPKGTMGFVSERSISGAIIHYYLNESDFLLWEQDKRDTLKNTNQTIFS